MPARQPRAVRVGALMASNTLQRRDPFALGPADDVREMPVPVVALLRVVRSRMAVDAARMRKYRIDLLPCGQAVRSRGRSRRFALLAFWRRIGCPSDNRPRETKRRTILSGCVALDFLAAAEGAS